MRPRASELLLGGREGESSAGMINGMQDEEKRRKKRKRQY